MTNKQSYKEKLDMLEKSNRFPQAGALKKMLEEDNQKLFKFIDDGNDLKNVPMNNIGGDEQNIDSNEHFQQVSNDGPETLASNDYQPL
ncbi:hypothetical protein M9Y10_011180 [Tritrichomonas musculus]|uniref:Uncharacterized protein n=1 Tax=Tritrichomonas musculus TaxID=1915356 RepID=A0ABR2IKC0_9EUKA